MRRNGITRYEITAVNLSDPSQTYLIAYSPRRSRQGLLHAMQSVGPQIVERLGITDEHMIEWQGGLRSSATVAGWRIGFTGRTQLEAKRVGEPRWIAEGSPR